MAVIFKEELKKQRNLIYVFLLAIFLIVIVVWQGFLKKEEPVLEEEGATVAQSPKIDFEILKNPILKELQPFLGLPIFSGEELSTSSAEQIGRDNPFLE